MESQEKGSAATCMASCSVSTVERPGEKAVTSQGKAVKRRWNVKERRCLTSLGNREQSFISRLPLLSALQPDRQDLPREARTEV